MTPAWLAPPPAVILAAGAGTRLGSAAGGRSKAMVPVAGRPLIAWLVDELAAAGLGRLVVVGHVGDADLARWCRTHPADLRYVTQAQRAGIAAAIRCALPALTDAPAYLACACDSLYRPDDLAVFVRQARRSADIARLAVLEMGPAATAARSAVVTEGARVVRIVEKPAPGTAPSGLVALPLYWLPRRLDPYLGRRDPAAPEAYVTTALDAFIREGGLVLAHPMAERLEVTTPADLTRAEAWLRARPGAH